MVLVQPLIKLRPFVSGDIATILLPPDAVESVVQRVAGSAALFSLLRGVFSARWAAKQCRLKPFTEEWANTLEFLIANPQFLDADKNGKKFVRALTILCPKKGPHYERSRDPT
jgi:hypothetical protein